MLVAVLVVTLVSPPPLSFSFTPGAGFEQQPLIVAGIGNPNVSLSVLVAIISVWPKKPPRAVFILIFAFYHPGWYPALR